jgi:hypothetical protein
LRGGSDTRILSRNQKDLGKKFTKIRDAIAALDVQDAIIDYAASGIMQAPERQPPLGWNMNLKIAKRFSSAAARKLCALVLMVGAFSQFQGHTQSAGADDNQALQQVVERGGAILLQKYGYKPYKGQGPAFGLPVDSGSGTTLTVGAGEIAVAVYSANNCVSASAQIGRNGEIKNADTRDGFPVFWFNYSDSAHSSGDIAVTLQRISKDRCSVQYRYCSKQP